MTVSSTTVKKSYNGNGSTAGFTYDFLINSTAELKVIIRSSAGTETVKSLSSHYNISDSVGSGTVTFTSGNIPANGETIILIRDTNLTQGTDYVENDPFPSASHESALDKLTLQVQEVQEELDRAIKLSRTNTMTSTQFTVGSTDRASKVLAFDSSGEISVTQELGTVKGNWGASTAYAIRDIVKDTSTNNIFIALTAHTSSGSQPITTNTDAAKWSLLVDAASATSSASAASGSASTATTKANEAAASASTASGHKDTATTKASEATTAKNAAVTAQAAAEAALDSFDDRYLGAKSSAPSTDNDSNALITGALYFNTSSNQIFAWTSSDAWEAIKPTSSEQTNINALSASAVITDMSLLATSAVIEDMGLLATSAVIEDLGLLAVSGVIEDMGILATTAIVEDLGILATSTNVTNMAALSAGGVVGNIATVAGAVSNVNTTASNIAGVNSFAERYRIASSAPSSSLNEGDLYYDTNANTLNFYNGSAWSAIVADTDVKVLVSSNDSTAGFLNGKIVAGTGISLTENNNGSNETLTITSTGATLDDATALSIALG